MSAENKAKDGVDLLNQNEWFGEMKRKLIDANMKADSNECERIIAQAAQIYGNDYSRQWRNLVLEEHGRMRVVHTFNAQKFSENE